MQLLGPASPPLRPGQGAGPGEMLPRRLGGLFDLGGSGCKWPGSVRGGFAVKCRQVALAPVLGSAGKFLICPRCLGQFIFSLYSAIYIQFIKSHKTNQHKSVLCLFHQCICAGL